MRKTAERDLRKLYASIADQYRNKLVEVYGEAGRKVHYAEAFEICEYGYEERQPKVHHRELASVFPLRSGEVARAAASVDFMVWLAALDTPYSPYPCPDSRTD